jgi:hypothetical protein
LLKGLRDEVVIIPSSLKNPDLPSGWRLATTPEELETLIELHQQLSQLLQEIAKDLKNTAKHLQKMAGIIDQAVREIG